MVFSAVYKRGPREREGKGRYESNMKYRYPAKDFFCLARFLPLTLWPTSIGGKRYRRLRETATKPNTRNVCRKCDFASLMLPVAAALLRWPLINGADRSRPFSFLAAKGRRVKADRNPFVCQRRLSARAAALITSPPRSLVPSILLAQIRNVQTPIPCSRLLVPPFLIRIRINATKRSGSFILGSANPYFRSGLMLKSRRGRGRLALFEHAKNGRRLAPLTNDIALRHLSRINCRWARAKIEAPF